MSPLAADPTGVGVRVYVIPGASHTEVCGLHGDAVKIRLSVAPEKGAANKALASFLADRCGVRKRSVRIVRGQTSRHKIVHIEGVTRESVRQSLGLDVTQDEEALERPKGGDALKNKNP